MRECMVCNYPAARFKIRKRLIERSRLVEHETAYNCLNCGNLLYGIITPTLRK